MAGSTPKPGAGNCLRVSRAEDAVLIQVIGLGNMLLAPTLQALVESELRSGHRNFIVDLRDCCGMDSTFMGTFIGLSTLVKNAYGWFCLVHVSDENMRLLKMLGVLHMVNVHEGKLPLPEGTPTVLQPTSDPYVRLKQIDSAHRNLVDANPENRKLFGPFIDEINRAMSPVPTILPPGEPGGESRGSST